MCIYKILNTNDDDENSDFCFLFAFKDTSDHYGVEYATKYTHLYGKLLFLFELYNCSFFMLFILYAMNTTSVINIETIILPHLTHCPWLIFIQNPINPFSTTYTAYVLHVYRGRANESLDFMLLFFFPLSCHNIANRLFQL